MPDQLNNKEKIDQSFELKLEEDRTSEIHFQGNKVMSALMEQNGGKFVLSLKALDDKNVHMRWKVEGMSSEMDKWILVSKAGENV